MPEGQSSLQEAMNKILGTTASVSNTPVAATPAATAAATPATSAARQAQSAAQSAAGNVYGKPLPLSSFNAAGAYTGPTTIYPPGVNAASMASINRPVPTGSSPAVMNAYTQQQAQTLNNYLRSIAPAGAQVRPVVAQRVIGPEEASQYRQWSWSNQPLWG
jgi:hypothetical protein